MKISFVTPTYNRAHLLLDTVDSILESIRYFPEVKFELIIVDDASSDDTVNLVRDKYSSGIEDGSIVYDRLSNNIGVTGAKNRGVQISKGDWIVFIDSDDLIIPSAFADFMKVLIDKSDFDVIFFSCQDFNGNRIGVDFDSYEISLNKYLKFGTNGEKLPVLKRSVIDAYPYNSNLRGFESTAYIKMLLAGKRFWLCNYVVRKYRQDNQDRLSGRFALLKRSKLLYLGYTIIIEDLKKNHFKVPKTFYFKKILYKIVMLF